MGQWLRGVRGFSTFILGFRDISTFILGFRDALPSSWHLLKEEGCCAVPEQAGYLRLPGESGLHTAQPRGGFPKPR